jgi:hypothetical protein
MNYRVFQYRLPAPSELEDLNSYLRSKRVASVTHHLAITAGGASQGLHGVSPPPKFHAPPSQFVAIATSLRAMRANLFCHARVAGRGQPHPKPMEVGATRCGVPELSHCAVGATAQEGDRSTTRPVLPHSSFVDFVLKLRFGPPSTQPLFASIRVHWRLSPSASSIPAQIVPNLEIIEIAR